MTRIGHAVVTDLLTAHVDGALAPDDHALVERHLDDCATCRADCRELAALAAVVASQPAPPPISFGAFWVRLERRLPQRRSWWPFEAGRRRWVLAPVLALAVLLAGMGVAAYASESALPDSPLYPVKLLREDVELQLTSSPAERSRLIAHFADTRLDEAARLVREGKDGLAVRTVERFEVLLGKLNRPVAPAPANREVQSSLESFENELNRVEAAADARPAVRETVERARESVQEQEREHGEREDKERSEPKPPAGE